MDKGGRASGATRSVEGAEVGAADIESFEGVVCSDGVRYQVIGLECVFAWGRRRAPKLWSHKWTEVNGAVYDGTFGICRRMEFSTGGVS